MKTADIGWMDFKLLAAHQLAQNGAYIYRGQRDSTWTLVTSLHRTAIVRNPQEVVKYINNILPLVLDPVSAWSNKVWDLASPLGLAEFLAFLQHNGFPTPLLDWTYSPYIAAYFAFESINHFAPQNENVAIYAFNQALWREKHPRAGHADVAAMEPTLATIAPRLFGNHKLALQQGCFTYANVANVEQFVQAQEQVHACTFMEKYVLPVEERPYAIRELSLMGTSAIQLDPCIESVCKKALEDIIRLQPVVRDRPPSPPPLAIQ